MDKYKRQAVSGLSHTLKKSKMVVCRRKFQLAIGQVNEQEGKWTAISVGMAPAPWGAHVRFAYLPALIYFVMW